MTLRINSEAPNFAAETTQGAINFHDWIGGGWAGQSHLKFTQAAGRREPCPGGSQGIVTRNAAFKPQKLTQKSLFRPAKVLHVHASLATGQYRQQGNQQHLLQIMARRVASPWVLNFMK